MAANSRLGQAKKWRPANWDAIVKEANPNYPQLFETGADAILEALKEDKSTTYSDGSNPSVPKGWLIFLEE